MLSAVVNLIFSQNLFGKKTKEVPSVPLNETPILVLNEIGVLYNSRSPLYKEIIKMTTKLIKERLHVNDKNVKQIYKFVYRQGFEEYAASQRVALEDWRAYVFKEQKENNVHRALEEVEKNDFLCNMLEHAYTTSIYLVTLSPKKFSKKIQERLGIDHLIKETFVIDSNNNSKKIYAKIRNQTLGRVTVVGNSLFVSRALDNSFEVVKIGYGANRDIKNHIKSIYELPDVVKNL